MKSIQNIFSDNEGNHLLVALNFYDKYYKINVLNIPEEFSDIEIVDISIEKVFVDQPIHFSVFFKMSKWMFNIFKKEEAIFSYTCSIDELKTNHESLDPQSYRKTLFDALSSRMLSSNGLQYVDFKIGTDEFKTFGRVFYKDLHRPIIHIVMNYLQDKYSE